MNTGAPFYKIILMTVVIFAACTKDKSYVYEVNKVTVQQPGSVKTNAKTTIEFISIAYSHLFGTTITNDRLVKINAAYSSFGDKKLMEDRIIRNFLNDPSAVIPAEPAMRANLSQFVTDTYKKFLNRDPNAMEKYFLSNLIQNDTSIKPDMVYYSFMTSNEYRYY